MRSMVPVFIQEYFFIWLGSDGQENSWRLFRTESFLVLQFGLNDSFSGWSVHTIIDSRRVLRMFVYAFAVMTNLRIALAKHLR